MLRQWPFFFPSWLFSSRLCGVSFLSFRCSFVFPVVLVRLPAVWRRCVFAFADVSGFCGVVCLLFFLPFFLFGSAVPLVVCCLLVRCACCVSFVAVFSVLAFFSVVVFFHFFLDRNWSFALCSVFLLRWVSFAGADGLSSRKVCFLLWIYRGAVIILVSVNA